MDHLSEHNRTAAVRRAHSAGASWTQIGAAHWISKQAAWEQYRTAVGEANDGEYTWSPPGRSPPRSDDADLVIVALSREQAHALRELLAEQLEEGDTE